MVATEGIQAQGDDRFHTVVVFDNSSLTARIIDALSEGFTTRRSVTTHTLHRHPDHHQVLIGEAQRKLTQRPATRRNLAVVVLPGEPRPIEGSFQAVVATKELHPHREFRTGLYGSDLQTLSEQRRAQRYLVNTSYCGGDERVVKHLVQRLINDALEVDENDPVPTNPPMNLGELLEFSGRVLQPT